MVSEAIWTLVASVKVVEMPLLLPVRVAFTVTCPTAEGEKVTVVCALPVESVVVEVWLSVAAPAGDTVHATAVLAMVTAAGGIGELDHERSGRLTGIDALIVAADHGRDGPG